MISFILNVFRLFRAIYIGLKSDNEFKAIFFLLITLLLSSSVFYMRMEGWGFIDAIYFSVMTMATIGYGDIVPTSNISKVFTIIFTFLGTGVFVALNAKIVLIILKNKEKNALNPKQKGAVNGRN